ncbi:MAG: hypothetical protein GF399_07210 [Candidatus Coatesbacteria bacterium]|nr:hypothetical protein [Candidatus Coatesbacteria bacterium]
MRNLSLLIVGLLVLATAAAALDTDDILALLDVGVDEDDLVEVIKVTESTPRFDAQNILFVDDEYGIDEELLYHCLLAEPLSKDQVYALAKVDYDEEYFIQLIRSPGIAFEPDYAQLAPLDLDEDVRSALMMATPKGVTEPVDTAPKRASLTINISGENYQTSKSNIYFYILVDGEVVREVVDDKVDIYIGSASYNQFIFTSYDESLETGKHTVAIAVVPTDGGKPGSGTINSNILFSKRMDISDSYNRLNLVCKLIPGTSSYEMYEQ